MSLHYTGMVVQGSVDTEVYDDVTGSVAGARTLTGSIVDRLALARGFTHCQPFIVGAGLSNTSTQGSKSAKLDVYLQHGDSSGGGDMAEVDTGLRVAQQQIYNTGELTTDYKSWTTGTLRIEHTGVAYATLGVKRWIRTGAIITRPGLSTSTAGGQTLNVQLGLVMLKADNEPPTKKAIFPGSASVLFTTSTST